MPEGELLQDGPGCAETRRLALWFASRLDSAWLVQRSAAAAQALTRSGPPASANIAAGQPVAIATTNIQEET